MSLTTFFTTQAKDSRGNTRTYPRLGRIAGAFFGSIFAVTAFFGSFATVKPGERGVLVTLGKPGDAVLSEGPHLKFPFISEVRVMSVRVQKSEDTTEAATKDMQKVTAKVALNWTINPDSVSKMLREVGDEATIENNIIAPAVSEILKAATAKMTAEEVLLRRIELKTSIDEALIKRLTNYGLIIKDISLVNLDFDTAFNQAVEQKQIAEQQAKQAEYVAQKATQDAKAQVNAQKGQAESTVIQAKADAEAQLAHARAQSEAQKLLRQTITPELLQLKAIERWDGVMPSVLGSGNGGGGSNLLFNIPVQKHAGQAASTDDSSNDQEKEGE